MRILLTNSDYGLNKNGNVVCLDVGEISKDKKELLNLIEQKKWLSNWLYKKDMDSIGPELKPYISRISGKRFTKRKVLKLWNST